MSRWKFKKGKVYNYRTAATVWHEILAGFYFCGLAIFCVLRDLIFEISRLGQIGFSCWELIFAIFRKDPVLSVDNIFVFIEYVQKKYIF